MVATSWDRFTMERYCDLLVQWRKAANVLNRKGLTLTSIDSQGHSQVKVRPEVSLVAKWAGLLLKIEQEFGLTPAARSRIVVGEPEKKENTKARFFGQAAG
jgi:P27 family predicted phage terminase small subunit